jgi:DNA helicase-2/ATP-dependent DNA helicase PcrA
VDADRLLDGLDPAQRRAVTSPGRPLAILAGAGSGKTRVLTRRIAHRCLTGDADPRHVLAVTFTRRAAAELDSRLRTFGLRDLPAAGTFHALAYAQLRTAWAGAGQATPTLLDRKGKVLGRILGNTKRVGPSDLAVEIEWARARLVTPDRYVDAVHRVGRRTPVDPERIAEWYRRYEQEKRSRGLVDFDDLLLRCAEQIEGDPSFAAAQRWRFRHLFVDEYQDVNPLQERLLRAWLGDRDDLCVVGDANQAIYGWNGADATHLLDFTRHHPGAEVIELRDSYRSTPQVLAAAAAVLAGGRAAPRPLVAHRSDGPLPQIIGYRNDADEANGIARAVRDEHRPGRPWSSQAVLVRTNNQAALIETALRRASIPYRVRGARRFLDEPDVRDLLTRLDRMHEPLATTLADLDASVTRQRRELLGLDDADASPSFGPSGSRGETAEGGAGSLRGSGSGDLAGSDLVQLPDTAAGRRVAAFEQVVRLGQELLVLDPGARADSFPGWLRTVLLDESPESGDAVTIATFHAAKGLEWAVVHLAGIEAGYVPISHAKTPEARSEEERLFYVAVTRASDVLRCTWAKERTFGHDPVERSPSPFLGWVREATARLERAGTPTPAPERGLARSRAELADADDDRPGEGRNGGGVADGEPAGGGVAGGGPAGGPAEGTLDLTGPGGTVGAGADTVGPGGGGEARDPAALTLAVGAELRSWRAEQARKAKVRPTVVLSERALDGIARHRPRTADDLASIAGIGPLTRDRHGARLLAIVADVLSGEPGRSAPGADLPTR